jgi:hypothetical protein
MAATTKASAATTDKDMYGDNICTFLHTNILAHTLLSIYLKTLSLMRVKGRGAVLEYGVKTTQSL